MLRILRLRGLRPSIVLAIILSVMSTWCPSCCAYCLGGISDPSDRTQISLENLLPVGIVLVNVNVELQQLLCDHSHAQDGWHCFKAVSIKPHLQDSEEVALCDEIDYLVKFCYIKVTYRAAPDGAMALRIYLVPLELNNVEVVLRESPFIYLRRLLRRISNEVTWNGLHPTGESTPLIPNPKVCYSHKLCPITNMNVTLGLSYPCTHLQ